jgi:hypothetical protein
LKKKTIENDNNDNNDNNNNTNSNEKIEIKNVNEIDFTYNNDDLYGKYDTNKLMNG